MLKAEETQCPPYKSKVIANYEALKKNMDMLRLSAGSSEMILTVVDSS